MFSASLRKDHRACTPAATSDAARTETCEAMVRMARMSAGQGGVPGEGRWREAKISVALKRSGVWSLLCCQHDTFKVDIVSGLTSP
jgi:hypothetical protein